MKYRPEIDGLRALAVLPVVLFHAGLEVFAGGLSKHSHVFFKLVTVFLPECLRALKHRQLSYRICSQRSYLRCIPSRVRIGEVCFAVSLHVGREMIFQLFPVHQVTEKVTPGDLGRPLQVGCTVAVKDERGRLPKLLGRKG